MRRGQKKTTKTTLRSEWRGALKKNLTGPALIVATIAAFFAAFGAWLLTIFVGAKFFRGEWSCGIPLAFAIPAALVAGVAAFSMRRVLLHFDQMHLSISVFHRQKSFPCIVSGPLPCRMLKSSAFCRRHFHSLIRATFPFNQAHSDGVTRCHGMRRPPFLVQAEGNPISGGHMQILFIHIEQELAVCGGEFRKSGNPKSRVGLKQLKFFVDAI